MSWRRWAGRVLRTVFLLAGLTFLAVTFASTWDRAAGFPFPAWPAVAVGVAALVAGLLAALRGWAVLLGVDVDARLAAGFYTAQLGKYVPGGVWQAVGQVGYAAVHHVGRRRASAAFIVSSLTQAVAGITIGTALAVAGPGLGLELRAALLAGLAAVVLLHRGWMSAVLRRLPEAWSVSESLLPGQRAILKSTGWSMATLLANGVAFAAALDTTADWRLAAVLAFGVAWSIGFLALPFPAGLGIREAALVVLLPGVVPSAIIAASVLLRLAIMAVEAAIMGVTRLAEARSPDPTDPAGAQRDTPPD